MEGRQPVGAARFSPARSFLHWGAGVTVAWLVLVEQFADVVPALAAFAGGAWVFSLEQRRPEG